MTARVDDTLRHTGTTARVPRFVSLLSVPFRAILARGVPVGPNVLMTVRGRTSGIARTIGVAIIEVDGRRWIWSPWGETHWVRNLRAAGRATITVRRRDEEVTATELDEAERVAFFRDTFTPYARAMRGGVAFVRLVDQVRPRRSGRGGRPHGGLRAPPGLSEPCPVARLGA